jgi:hypothetical protein
MGPVSRCTGRILLAVGVLAGVVFASVGTASASCIVPFEPVALVTGRLAGEPIEERFHADLGQVLGVAELETVQVWEPLPEYTAASATVVSRYWGVRPPDERFIMDARFNARIDGGHYTGPGETVTTISCDPSVAQPLGSREYVAVFERSDLIHIEPAVTPAQEAIFTQHLGEPITVDPPTLPDTHPSADAGAPDDFAGDIEEVDTTPYWLFVAVGAVLAAGLVTWLQRRRRLATRRANAGSPRT